MTAACIADTILQPLYDFSNGLSIGGCIGCLALVSEWSQTFYHAYFEKTSDWQTFEDSEENIYHANSWDEFVSAWAEAMLVDFIRRNGGDPDRFVAQVNQ